MDITVVLPEVCISHIISFTSPKDACRSSVVSPVFKSAADANTVWERFLPPDYEHIISSSAAPWLLNNGWSKKDLYLHLCNNPIIINNGTMSFSLEKESGKKCYMVGARALSIIWGDDHYWSWPPLQNSRFAEVAQLNYVWWLDVKARIDTRILSPRTSYAAYLVFNFDRDRTGFVERPVQLGVYFEDRDDGERREVYLDTPRNTPQPSNGWMEIEMGEFFNENGEDGTLMCTLFDFHGGSCKGGLIVEGIELRPRNG